MARGIAFLYLILAFLPVGLGADLTYRLKLELFPGDGGWELRGTEVVEGHAPADTGELPFRFYQGLNAPFRVVSARNEAGELPVYNADPTTFSVEFPLSAGQTFSVTLEYAATVPAFPGGGYGTFSASADAVLVAQGYPMLSAWGGKGWVIEPVLPWGDSVVAEVADYTAVITHPVGWEVVATGEEEPAGPGVTVVHGENLREFAFVLVRGYAHTSSGEDPGVISWDPPWFPHAGAEARELSAEALRVYAGIFGEYPFAELDVVAVLLERAAGVEFPGLILAGVDYYRERERGQKELIFPMIFAHEVAHQWWYAQVGNDQVREPWVDEALATYTSGLAMERWGLFPELLEYWKSSYERGLSRNPAATPFDPLWRFPEGEGYGGIVYSGGALFFLEVEKAMGRGMLLEALRRYLGEYRWRIASGAELLRILREAGGPEVEEIIAHWRRGRRL